MPVEIDDDGMEVVDLRGSPADAKPPSDPLTRLPPPDREIARRWIGEVGERRFRAITAQIDWSDPQDPLLPLAIDKWLTEPSLFHMPSGKAAARAATLVVNEAIKTGNWHGRVGVTFDAAQRPLSKQLKARVASITLPELRFALAEARRAGKPTRFDAPWGSLASRLSASFSRAMSAMTRGLLSFGLATHASENAGSLRRGAPVGVRLASPLGRLETFSAAVQRQAEQVEHLQAALGRPIHPELPISAVREALEAADRILKTRESRLRPGSED